MNGVIIEIEAGRNHKRKNAQVALFQDDARVCKVNKILGSCKLLENLKLSQHFLQYCTSTNSDRCEGVWNCTYV